MRNSINKILIVVFFGSFLTSCYKGLDKFPANTLTSENAYKDEAGYKKVLARVYGSMVLTSQTAPATAGAGNGDVKGVDEGFSDFFRNYWTAQDMSTDMAKWKWADPGLYDMQFNKWDAANPLVEGLYGRCQLIITYANEFLRESTPEKLASRGITGSAADNIAQMRLEVRFVRAYQYWVLMDFYGKPGFTTDADQVGKFNPRQIDRISLFAYVEKELKEIEAGLLPARSNEYGRADKAATWALLARLYLNAQVYTQDTTTHQLGAARFTDAITYSKKVIDGGYTLMNNYQWLFLADNDQNNTEAIWTLNYDGLQSQTYGGATSLINGTSLGGSVDINGLGGWGALRVTEKIPALFPDVSGTIDKRALFYTAGQTLEMTDYFDYSTGFAVTKFRNRTRTGALGHDPGRTFSDVDIPIFRLAEMYLIYAEAVKRGGTGGSEAQAITYLNLIRQRAYGNTNGNISSYDTDFILNERGRELYWEGFRRTDLIRYNRYWEGTYLWPWKGGVKNGTAFSSNRTLFPIPSNQLVANPNLRQNPGY